MTQRIPIEAVPRVLRGTRAEELYLSLSPPLGDAPAEQARNVYTALCETLSAAGARIFAERVFATPEAIADVLAARRDAMNGLDDGVGPTRIAVEHGRTGGLAGVQIHAVAADARPEPVRCKGKNSPANGRRLVIDGDRWLTLSKLSSAGNMPPGEQARRMFNCTACFLRQEGADMRAVVRTWLWLKDICDWYGDLNAARTSFFKAEGLIAPTHGPPRLPASTGIGMGSANGAACALDLIALPGAEDRIELLAAGGHQNSAFAYGSAFSRAAIAPMPAGRTLFISGTAAIDAQGRTEHVGDAEAQIDATIRHIRALLADVNCSDAHVLSALVYCKTAGVEEAFHTGWAGLPWPTVSLIGDVCRPDLLFEIELVAGPVPENVRKE